MWTIPFEVELVLVEDGRPDGTGEVLAGLAETTEPPRRQGQGTAIRTASQDATGTHMLICDTELEYAPEEIPDCSIPTCAARSTLSTAPASSAATTPIASSTSWATRA